MKKHQIKNHTVLFKNTGTDKNQAFTLVELIIVITILAVLATIAFVSFSNYTASSRDTKRIVTIESISKGLNIFQTQTGKYPNVDNQSSTGIINSDILSFVGEVGDNVSRLINISPTPIDPVSGNNFKYATSFDNKYFQVAGTQEKPVAEKSIIKQSYANSRQAKVLGNYNGLLKKENKLYNLPSLLYTGSGNLLSNTTYFVIDKGQNIPYKISSTDLDNSVQTSVILSQLTGTSSVSLTGVTLPSTPGELKANIDSVVQILGYPGDKIGQESFGTQYFVASTSSSSSGGGGFDCYDPTNIGKIGSSGPCNGKLIVNNDSLSNLISSSGNYSGNNIWTWHVTDMSYLFDGETVNYDITGWDTINVTDMSMMFHLSSFNQNIGGWNVSNVTNMESMFHGSTFNQNIGSWNTANVTNMQSMFAETSSFDQNIGSWNTANVTNMQSMFHMALVFNQNIGSWNTSKVEDMSYMFYGAELFNQNIGSWNTTKVVNMEHMFDGASEFNQNIGLWDTAYVTNMNYMFANALKFNQDLQYWCGATSSNGGLKPMYFDDNTPAWNKTNRQPNWGASFCP